MLAEASPLLSTKFYLPPPRAGRVPRARLAQRLDRALRQNAVTLISAPAGFGKSALLAEWRASPAARGAQLAWLALDPDDNDPLRFLTYLATALAALDPAIGRQTRALLAESRPPEPRVLLTNLLADAAACLGAADPTARWVLALDDCQVLTAPEANAALAFLTENLPPGLALVLLSRSDPPLPLSRWRVKGRLAEFRTDDLRFSAAETRRFLNQGLGLGLRPREVARLETLTEGWPAALQLAALALRHPGPAAPDRDRLNAFGPRHRFVVDYLAGEVLAGLPPETRRLLESAAVLNRLCAPLCAALLGLEEGEAQARLDELERQNLFLIPLDSERRWFRFHHLFQEFLRGQWTNARAAEQRALHERAGAWLEAQGYLDEAVHHLLRAENYERLAALLPRAADRLLSTGGSPDLLRWVQALPPAIYDQSPRLALTAAWALSLQRQERPEVIEPYLEQALREPTPFVRGQIALIRAELAHGPAQPARALEQAQLAYTLLEGEHSHLSALAALNAGTAHWWLGHWTAAEQAATLAHAASGREHPAIYARVVALLLPIRVAQGQLRAAAEICQGLLEAVPPQAMYRYVRQAHLVLAELNLEWNALAEAAPFAASVAQPGPVLEPTWQLLAPREAHLLAARLAVAASDETTARAALAQARLGRHAPSGAWAKRLAAREARLWLDLGDRRSALKAFNGWEAGLPTFAIEFETLTLARLQLAQGQAAAALAGLRARLPAAEAEGRLGQAAENLMLQALGQHALGQAERASAALARALTLAQPGGYIRLFIAPGRAAQPGLLALLARVAEQAGPAAIYAQRLLAATETETSLPSAPEPKAPTAPLPWPLTAGERRVVALIAAGLSNDEIGRRLGISLNTVRTHNKSIFRKLDVRSRTQAAARAREAGLA